MAVGYRAILRLSRDADAVEIAEDQVRSWLKDKIRAGASDVAWDRPGHYQFGPRVELLVVHAEHETSGRRRLYRLIETNVAGRWGVSLYASSLMTGGGRQQTIVVEVDLIGADRETALSKVAPPRVVRSILDTVSASDGAVSLTGSAAIIRAGETSEVVQAIVTPDRAASVVVAVSPARDLDNIWREMLSSLITQSVGVTAAYAVAADAADELSTALPESHRTRAGEVRTYLPRVDLTDPNDSYRHKWLSLPTLTRSLKGRIVAEPLQRRHGEVARRRFVEAQLPSDVRRTIDVLRRAETGVERAAKVAAAVQQQPVVKPRVPDPTMPIAGSTEAPARSDTLLEKSWIERIAQSFKRWLGIETPEFEQIDALDAFVAAKVAEVAVAEEQLSDAAEREQALQSENDQLRRDLEDHDLDLAIAQEQQLRDQRELTILRRRIAASQHPEDAYVAADEEIWHAPASVEELVERLLPGDDGHVISGRVVFTGDIDKALEIDRRDATGRYAAAFWQQVRTLHDYAIARSGGFNGGVHSYLTDDRTDGIKCPVGQHASKESETVLNNAKWRQERVLPVPVEVDPSGKALMEAHFKPTWRDSFAPRMYYVDDVAGTGKIYVGYIGRHLTNTQT